MFSGDEVSDTTDMPDGWGDASSVEGLGRPAFDLVAPAVGDRPDAARCPSDVVDVAGDGVGVDEEDLLAVVELER